MRTGQVVHNNSPEQAGSLDHDKYASLILDSGSLVVKIYRRDIILGCESRFPEGIFYEDNALGNTWMLRAKHFAYMPEPMYYYYQHEASTVHTITRKRCEMCIRDRAEIYHEKQGGFLLHAHQFFLLSLIHIFRIISFC